MGSIRTDIGLITGIPITDTVNQLMAISARPRAQLDLRTQALESEQVAVTELTAFLSSLKVMTRRLGADAVYDQRTVSSSDTDVLSASKTGQPPKGTYSFRAVRTVQNQQTLSDGFTAQDEPLGEGTLTFRFGPDAQRSAELATLRGGEGFERGSIRITDRGGASAEIDLSTATTLDDVLQTITKDTRIAVTAQAVGDRIQLIDDTGKTDSNLHVQEVSGGTAASLGLAGIDTAAAVGDGLDLVYLSGDLDLDVLRDGGGIRTSQSLEDIEYTLADGTTGTIDLSPIQAGSSDVDVEVTLDDVLDVINAAEPGKLEASIDPDGDRLVLTDLSIGSDAFVVSAIDDSNALADLGLDGAAVENIITGDRLMGGLQSVLLDSLGGGSGLGDLGQIDLTDRNGGNASIDLASAETLEDVIDAINAAAVDILASVNDAGNGIDLLDTSGGTGNLIIANGDATNTADLLGLTLDDATDQAGTGDLKLRVISENTQLDDLNGGEGIHRGKFLLTESGGREVTINVSSDIEDVGDLLREINRMTIDTVAEINADGDGILLRDTFGGDTTLAVSELSSTTAADLNLLGTAVDTEIDGETVKAIDGSTTYSVTLDEDDTLEDLRDKINELDVGVHASVLVDGSSRPYRLALASERAGQSGSVVFDTSDIDLTLRETVVGRDAAIVFGETDVVGSGALITSSSNRFNNVLEGVSIKINEASDDRVMVTIGQTDTDLVAAMEVLVEKYNLYRDRFDKLTAFDAETGESGLLVGDATALRLDMDLARLLTDTHGTASGEIRALGQLGVRLEEDGQLSLDTERFRSRFEDNPEAVRQFFADESNGFSGEFTDLIDRLAGVEDSLLSGRIETLGTKIEANYERADRMTAKLDKERERMLRAFYRMEVAVSKMQNNLNALATLEPVAPLTSGSTLRFG